MKNYLTIVMLIATTLMSFNKAAHAQTWGERRAIQVNAEINASNPSIKLKWSTYATLTSIKIYKMSGGSWPSSPMATLSSTVTEFTDTNVSTNQAYEYKIKGTSSAGTDAVGYIATAIELDETTDKGLIVVLVDSTLMGSLTSELATYKKDAMGDGYDIIISDFDTALGSSILRDTIYSYYSTYSNLTSVFMVGAMPYAYTGNIYPDGHADHRGAWPSDMVYADINGTYSDLYVSYTNPTTPRLSNTTYDTKSDQSYLSSQAEIQIGRLDLSRLTAFSQSEVTLYRNYFAKLHNYKTGAFDPKAKGIVDDNFIGYSEGFSQNGYRNFSPLTSIDSVVDADIMTTLANDSILWTFACGSGSYTGISGFSNTAQLASNTVGGTFALVMGSYNADPDVNNNFMRSMLANGNFLTTGWAGRPNWFLHHMGLGKSIGHATLTTQNNTTILYEPTGFYAQMMHVMLLGDPSLKNHYTHNAADLTTIRTQSKDSVYLAWTQASNVLGYNVYRSTEEFTDYVKINSSLIANDSFIDVISADTSYYYRIEAVELVENASGSYYESSVGSYIYSDKNAAPLPVTLISFTGKRKEEHIQLNWVVADEIDFSHYSLQKLNEQTNNWGELAEVRPQSGSNDIKNYLQNDNAPVIGRNIYRLKMVNYDGSFEYSKPVVVLYEEGLSLGEFNVFPTIAKETLHLECDLLNANQNREFYLSDVKGRIVMYATIDRQNNSIDIGALPQGVYFVSDNELNGTSKKIIKTN